MSKIHPYLKFLPIVIWVILLLPVSLYYSSLLEKHVIASYGLLFSSGLLIVSLFGADKKTKNFEINFTDILITGYALYIIVNALLVRPHPVFNFFWLNFLSVILVYISVRLMTKRKRNIGLGIILLYGILETILILLQSCGLLESKHLLFNNTGSFPNPGLVGGFLAFSICILIHFIIKSKKARIFFCFWAILMIYALYLSDSRAAWLSALVGIFYLLWYSDIKLVNLVKDNIKGSLIIKLILISIFLVSLFFIYQHKKDSADGRLFIWENSLSMVKDKTITGHGIGMFKEKYSYYQADYFIKNPDSSKSMVAGNPSTPFNEFFSVLTMQGLVGFLFLVSILLSLFLYKGGSLLEKRKRAFLLAFCVFAFFSYPTSNYRLLILLPFFVGILPSKVVFSIGNQKIKIVGLAFISIILLGTSYYGIKMVYEYNRLSHTFQLNTHSHTHDHDHSHNECCNDCDTDCDHKDCHVSISEKQYEKIKHDHILFQNYFAFIINKLSDEDKFILTKEYVELYPSSQGFCELGRMYKERKDYQKAKDYFTLAYHINPSLITPNYELFKLYQEIGDTRNMIEIGNKALNQHIKREGTETLTIKAYIKNTLNNLSD